MSEFHKEIVSMLEHKGTMYVATKHHIYVMVGGVLKSVEFEIIEEIG
jgi:hypothetical protein